MKVLKGHETGCRALKRFYILIKEVDTAVYVHRDFTVCKLYHILKRLPGKKKNGFGAGCPTAALSTE